MEGLREEIALLAEGKALSREQARQAFEAIMSGEVEVAQLAAFVMALRLRGETVDEIAGGAEILRRKAATLRAPEGAIDTCGTGGDSIGTFNISTAAAIVTAACGVPVAKHGNRAVSSKSGSADVLATLGIEIEADLEVVQHCLDTIGIAFLMAPRHHGAMRHVAPVRKSLGLRTIFNLLGPLANPAGADRQLIGVFDRRWLRPIAEVLKTLGSRHVWVVHGRDGLDEISVTGPTDVVELKEGVIREFTVNPKDAGLATHPIDALLGGDAEANAQALRSLLAGTAGAYRDIVLINSAAALIVADKADDLREGIDMGAKAIDSGAASQLLAEWVDASHRDVS